MENFDDFGDDRQLAAPDYAPPPDDEADPWALDAEALALDEKNRGRGVLLSGGRGTGRVRRVTASRRR